MNRRGGLVEVHVKLGLFALLLCNATLLMNIRTARSGRSQ